MLAVRFDFTLAETSVASTQTLPAASEPTSTMGFGAFAEPLVVVTLLFGGAWFNRTTAADHVSSKLADYTPLENARKRSDDYSSPRRSDSESDSLPSDDWTSTSGTLSPLEQSRWRNRRVRAFGYERMVSTPNTAVFKDRLLSRVLQKFPFLAEAWYWALIYWVSLTESRVRLSCDSPLDSVTASLDPRNRCLTLFFRCTNWAGHSRP